MKMIENEWVEGSMDLLPRRPVREFRKNMLPELVLVLVVDVCADNRFDRVRSGRYRHTESIETIVDLESVGARYQRQWQCTIHRDR